MVPLCWNCHDSHDAIECETLKKLDLPETYLIDNFDVVTPLRVLILFYRYAALIMTTTPNGASTDTTATTTNTTAAAATTASETDLKFQIDEILSMESHCNERQGTWIWNEHAKNVLQPLRSINIDAKFQSLNAPWTLSDDFLQKICGILDVNTFEFRTQHFEVEYENDFTISFVLCCCCYCCLFFCLNLLVIDILYDWIHLFVFYFQFL